MPFFFFSEALFAHAGLGIFHLVGSISDRRGDVGDYACWRCGGLGHEIAETFGFETLLDSRSCWIRGFGAAKEGMRMRCISCYGVFKGIGGGLVFDRG